MKPSQQRSATSPPKPRTRAPRAAANESIATAAPVEIPVVTCDGCGREVGRDAAIREAMNGDVAIYCGEPCRAQGESPDLASGPDWDEPT